MTEATPQHPRDLRFQVQVLPMPLLYTPDQGGSSSLPPVHQATTTSTSEIILPGMTVRHDSAHADPPSASTVQPTTAQPVQLPTPPPILPGTVIFGCRSTAAGSATVSVNGRDG